MSAIEIIDKHIQDLQAQIDGHRGDPVWTLWLDRWRAIRDHLKGLRAELEKEEGTMDDKLKVGDHIFYKLSNGEERPGFVVRVWPDEFGPGVDGYNCVVFVDGGNDKPELHVDYNLNQNPVLWVTSAKQGEQIR